MSSAEYATLEAAVFFSVFFTGFFAAGGADTEAVGSVFFATAAGFAAFFAAGFAARAEVAAGFADSVFFPISTVVQMIIDFPGLRPGSHRARNRRKMIRKAGCQ